MLLTMKKIGEVWMFKGSADHDNAYQSFRRDGEAGKFSAGETVDCLLAQYPNSYIQILGEA